jgi:RimJ/RimL family protein N-acetyltransferase
VTLRLRTGRIDLRRFTLADVDLLVELDNDPAVMRYINGGLPVPRAEIADDVLPAFLAYHERGDDHGFWAAVERDSGRFLGWFHLRPGHGAGPHEPELGYRLHTFAWGRGYATEVSRALIDDGFASRGAERVTAETMVVNVASRRVMEKVGMRLVRTFHADWPVRIAGDEYGDVEYAITRQEWLSGRG